MRLGNRWRAIQAGFLCFCLILFGWGPVQADEDGPGNLYSLSAVLMDGDTGRVLYGKDQKTLRAMASTTKVMTCILALEHASGADEVVISDQAVLQPEIKMNVKKGERYRMEDLLYAMMLKSYNDVAVAVAEHVGGSVKEFAKMMNEKAAAIGCRDTHFVTPNGLDAIDDQGQKHMTTAEDLALIMRYAIQNPTFLGITQAREYAFWDIDQTRNFSVHNANAYLDMREGMLSGKTGFTGNAGYCYVGAYRNRGRTFIVALLGCGWPNNKTYKWRDMDALLSYGERVYHQRTFWQEPELSPVFVENGIPSGGNLREPCMIPLICPVSQKERTRTYLLKEEEQIEMKQTMKEHITAPVQEGEKLGEVVYTLNGRQIAVYPILAGASAEPLTYSWCVNKVFRGFFHD